MALQIQFQSAPIPAPSGFSPLKSRYENSKLNFPRFSRPPNLPQISEMASNKRHRWTIRNSSHPDIMVGHSIKPPMDLVGQSGDYLLEDAVLADLGPGTAKFAIGLVGPLLSGFGFLFILRIVMSWYPKLPVGKFPYVIAYAPTEPFLSPTRKLIKPVGGVDVTPVVWFAIISFLNEILVGPQGLLVLLSQQV